jgi:hypothetical protein
MSVISRVPFFNFWFPTTLNVVTTTNQATNKDGLLFYLEGTTFVITAAVTCVGYTSSVGRAARKVAGSNAIHNVIIIRF